MQYSRRVLTDIDGRRADPYGWQVAPMPTTYSNFTIKKDVLSVPSGGWKCTSDGQGAHDGEKATQPYSAVRSEMDVYNCSREVSSIGYSHTPIQRVSFKPLTTEHGFMNAKVHPMDPIEKRLAPNKKGKLMESLPGNNMIKKGDANEVKRVSTTQLNTSVNPYDKPHSFVV